MAVQMMSGFIGVIKSRCDNRGGSNWFREKRHPTSQIRSAAVPASASADTDNCTRMCDITSARKRLMDGVH
jgi:hypothetical protein